MHDVWLCVKEKETSQGDLKPWVGVQALDDRNPTFHFKIQGSNGMVTIRSGMDFEWKLVVEKSGLQAGNPRVGFVLEKDVNKERHLDEFLMDMGLGEHAFHLISDNNYGRYHLKLNIDKKDNYPMELEKNYQVTSLGELTVGKAFFTFGFGQKWYVLAFAFACVQCFDLSFRAKDNRVNC